MSNKGINELAGKVYRESKENEKNEQILPNTDLDSTSATLNEVKEEQSESEGVPQCILDRLGGSEIITAAVEIFFKKMLSDDLVKDFFEDVDMNHHKEQHAKFQCSFMSGKTNNGASMKEVHKGMGVKSCHYDRTIEHLLSSLKELNVSEEAIDAYARPMIALKPDIVED